MKKRLYRGIPYEVASHDLPAPTSSGPQPPVRLIYRGNTYEYYPQAQVIPEAFPSSDAPIVTLKYRGQSYQRRIPPIPYQRPRALNWRWQYQVPH